MRSGCFWGASSDFCVLTVGRYKKVQLNRLKHPESIRAQRQWGNSSLFLYFGPFSSVKLSYKVLSILRPKLGSPVCWAEWRVSRCIAAEFLPVLSVSLGKNHLRPWHREHSPSAFYWHWTLSCEHEWRSNPLALHPDPETARDGKKMTTRCKNPGHDKRTRKSTY